MANTPQAKKRARQNEKRFQVNKARRSRIRTHLRRVEEAIASGDKDAAGVALKAAQPELMRGVTKVFITRIPQRAKCRACLRGSKISHNTIVFVQCMSVAFLRRFFISVKTVGQ